MKELRSILNSRLIVVQRDRQKGLREAFTFDSDFRVHGFKTVPE